MIKNLWTTTPKEEDRPIFYGEMLTEMRECQTRWNTFAKKQIDKCLQLRDFIYDQATEEGAVVFKGSVAGIEKATLNQSRAPLNRVKTDFRDLQPYFNLKPRTKGANDEKKIKLYQAIFDQKVLAGANMANIYAAYDDVADMSLCVMQLDVKAKYVKNSIAGAQIQKSILINKVDDITTVYFDSSVPLRDINRDGNDVGVCRMKEITGSDGLKTEVEVHEHWHKIIETKVYGERYDPFLDKVICEEVQTGKAANDLVYNFKYSIDEVVAIRHVVFEDNDNVIDERWSFMKLPYVLGFGVFIDRFNDNKGDRLTLVPFAETTKSPQILLDYAVTAQQYNLKSTRGTTKFMYPAESIKGFEKQWKNRNNSEVDLPYNLITDPETGSFLPIKPEPVADNQISPQVSEIMQTYPVLIGQLLGSDPEQDISFNKSGEAIKQTQIIRYKNSKIYTDNFLVMLDYLGECLVHYIPRIMDRPQSITIDMYGETVVEEINTREDNTIKNLWDQYDVTIEVGSVPQVKMDKTNAACEKIITATAMSPLSPAIISNSIDIYASSFDTPDAPELAKRFKQLVPNETKALSRGDITQEDLVMQQQQAAQGQQQQQQFMQGMAFADEQAKLLAAQGKADSGKGALLRGQADMIKAQQQIPIEDLKAAAEITKAGANNAV